MGKKITNEEIAKIIVKITKKNDDELEQEYKVKKLEMFIAEDDLVESLNDEQKEMYKIYQQKKDDFYAFAREYYKEKN